MNRDRGISTGDLETIFEEFYQINKWLGDKTPGTGLGLSLVQQMVPLHQGRVWARSDGEGKGSAFSFVIPVGGTWDLNSFVSSYSKEGLSVCLTYSRNSLMAGIGSSAK